MGEKEIVMRKKEINQLDVHGFSSRKEQLQYHLWKFIGRYIFKMMIGPVYGLRRWYLRLFGATIGSGTNVSNHAIIVMPSWITIGKNVSVDDYVYFNAKAIIGDDVSLSSYVKIISGGHDVRDKNFTYIHKPVKIGKNAFIGANSVLMGGVVISDFVAVGANSFVLHDVPENSIAYGNPCEVKSKRYSADTLNTIVR